MRIISSRPRTFFVSPSRKRFLCPPDAPARPSEKRILRDFREEDITFGDRVYVIARRDFSGNAVLAMALFDEDVLLDGRPSARIAVPDGNAKHPIGVGIVYTGIVSSIEYDLRHTLRRKNKPVKIIFRLADFRKAQTSAQLVYSRHGENIIETATVQVHDTLIAEPFYRVYRQDSLKSGAFNALPELSDTVVAVYLKRLRSIYGKEEPRFLKSKQRTYLFHQLQSEAG